MCHNELYMLYLRSYRECSVISHISLYKVSDCVHHIHCCYARSSRVVTSNKVNTSTSTNHRLQYFYIDNLMNCCYFNLSIFSNKEESI